MRKALLHPSCNPGRLWADPSTLEEWNEDPSRKLDTLVEVIRWHLALDARAPLRVVEDNLVPSAISANSANENSLAGGAPCDKVLVYCAFPSSYTQVMKVLLFSPYTSFNADLLKLRFYNFMRSRRCRSTAK